MNVFATLPMGSCCARYLCVHSVGLRYMDVQVQSDAGEETNPDDRGGCILAHNMGLGKSFQTIAFLHSYHHHFPGQHTLVVMPKNVLWNWKEEFNLWLSLTKGSELTVEKVRLSQQRLQLHLEDQCVAKHICFINHGHVLCQFPDTAGVQGWSGCDSAAAKCHIKGLRAASSCSQGCDTVCCPEGREWAVGSLFSYLSPAFWHLLDHPLAAL